MLKPGRSKPDRSKLGRSTKKITRPQPKSHRVGDFDITFEPAGLSPDRFKSLREHIISSAAVKTQLGRSRARLLALDLVDNDKGDGAPADAERFRATIYDYTNNRTLYAEGALSAPTRLTLSESSVQPVPSNEEMAAAFRLVSRHNEFASAVSAGELAVYPAMPAIVGEELPDGRRRRVVAVGVLPSGGADRHEIVGVALDRNEVIRFPNRTPFRAQADAGTCGVPYDQQATTRNDAGQVWINISQGGNLLWRFLAVRPAASSGTNGSGVELRHVAYKGKGVLYRAHVPFLNVKYSGDACGPYRDWQNEEGMIKATGVDVAPGFRLCLTPATTILESGNDKGNFLGTAVYVQGQEVVLVCEMEAGWYRYVSQWRFHADGTLKPRFGFSAVQSSCVCNVHYHHCYWRLDFDIKTPGSNLVREFNDPPLGASKWQDRNYEAARPRDPSRKRYWRVLHVPSGSGYDVIPGPDDGMAAAAPDAPYGRGDVWITRYRNNEIDDGVTAVGPPYEANIDQWVNGESIKNTDLVFWYAAHFVHDVHHSPPGVHGHIVGPDLKPYKW
jgi:hypothetical protein